MPSTRRVPVRVLSVLLGFTLTAVLAGVVMAIPAHAQTLDPYGIYEGQVSCDPVAKPGVLAARALLRKKFGGGDLGIVRACNVGGTSEHKEGRAWDWAWNAHRKHDRRHARRALNWLTRTVDGVPAAHARDLGVMYMIWNHRMWRAYRPDAGWLPYTGPDPHTSHIHLSFTWNGATMRTAFWQHGVVQPIDFGPCQVWVGEYAPKWTAPNPTPCPDPLRHPVADANGYYTAQYGETPARVAGWFHLTEAQVRQWNGWPLDGDVWIPVGQKILVKDPGTTPPPTTPPPVG